LNGSGAADYSYDPSALAAGTYSLTAIYAGDSTFVGSTSAAQTLTVVVGEATNTTLTLSPSSVVVGSAGPVVMTATVTSKPPGVVPTGTVSFFNGVTQIGTAALDSEGVATFNYDPSALAVGTYMMTAVYGGGGDLAGSTSSPVPLVVANANTNVFTLGVANPAQDVAAGEAATYTITVTSKNGFAGPVTLSCSGQPANALVSFSPATLVLPADGTAQATLTIKTSQLMTGNRPSHNWELAKRGATRVNGLMLAAVLPSCSFGGLIAVLGGMWKRKKRARRRLLLFLTALALLLLVLGWAGCGSNHQTYAITVTGTANASPRVTASTTVTLTVH
jgi:hypothetical protein